LALVGDRQPGGRDPLVLYGITAIGHLGGELFTDDFDIEVASGQRLVAALIVIEALEASASTLLVGWHVGVLHRDHA